jgi:hypothetical protein
MNAVANDVGARWLLAFATAGLRAVGGRRRGHGLPDLSLSGSPTQLGPTPSSCGPGSAAPASGTADAGPGPTLAAVQVAVSLALLRNLLRHTRALDPEALLACCGSRRADENGSVLAAAADAYFRIPACSGAAARRSGAGIGPEERRSALEVGQILLSKARQLSECAGKCAGLGSADGPARARTCVRVLSPVLATWLRCLEAPTAAAAAADIKAEAESLAFAVRALVACIERHRLRFDEEVQRAARRMMDAAGSHSKPLLPVHRAVQTMLRGITSKPGSVISAVRAKRKRSIDHGRPEAAGRPASARPSGGATGRRPAKTPRSVAGPDTTASARATAGSFAQVRSAKRLEPVPAGLQTERQRERTGQRTDLDFLGSATPSQAGTGPSERGKESPDEGRRGRADEGGVAPEGLGRSPAGAGAPVQDGANGAAAEEAPPLAKVERLEQRCRRLEEDNAGLKRAMATLQAKVDAISARIAGGGL